MFQGTRRIRHEGGPKAKTSASRSITPAAHSVAS
jgi:hypothetical protein